MSSLFEYALAVMLAQVRFVERVSAEIVPIPRFGGVVYDCLPSDVGIAADFRPIPLFGRINSNDVPSYIGVATDIFPSPWAVRIGNTCTHPGKAFDINITRR